MDDRLMELESRLAKIEAIVANMEEVQRPEKYNTVDEPEQVDPFGLPDEPQMLGAGPASKRAYAREREANAR